MTHITDLIKQIQKDITSEEISIENILLKVKILAYYLDNDELKKWAKNELDGYSNTDNLPDYRIMEAHLLCTFTNGYRTHKNRMLSIREIPPELLESFGQIEILEGVIAVEEMSKEENIGLSVSGDWIRKYNIANAQFLSEGGYQLVKAYYPILRGSFRQILGSVRSRLLEFVLEISNLPWDIENKTTSTDKITNFVQLFIYHNSGNIDMPDFQPKDGDTYNVVGQAGAVGKYAKSDGNTFIQSDQKQTLAEAAAEIQKLLKQLEQGNPSITESEMIAYINDETTPSLKRRTAAAAKAFGESVIDEYVLEAKPLKVVKAVIKGWIEADS